MRYKSNFLALVVFVLTAACAGGGSVSATVEEYCNRADDCNLLPLGTSIEDCTQQVDKLLESLTENERADYELGLKGCLALKSCSAFGDC